jgi:lipopolysaccharide transport system ATP-binding protein
LKPLLDEVLAVGDVGFQAKCFNMLAEYRQRGTAFILVSHNMHQIARYCQSVVYLKRGQISFQGKVEQGIGAFLSDMKQSGSNGNQGPDWTVANGSGKVVFTGAKFLNGSGETIEKAQAGAPLTFEVAFERRTETVVDPVFDVLVRSRGEIIFQATNRSCEQSFGELPKAGKLVLHFGNLPCNSGPLDFYFCLLNGQSNELYDWKRDLRIEVESDPTQTGSLHLAAHWEVIDNEQLTTHNRQI